MVFDFGAGSLSISVMVIGNDVVEVSATVGSTLLGGLDYDTRISNHISENFYQESKFDVRIDPIACQRLIEAAETAKTELFAADFTEIYIPCICQVQGEIKNIEIRIEMTYF